MIPTCAVCGSAMRERRDWLFHCCGCGLWSSALAPGAGTGIQGLEALRQRNNALILDRLERHMPLPGRRLLEVGSAWGWFLEAAALRGATVVGIEPEAKNAALARERLGIAVEHGFFPQDLADRGPYDVVAFNDVFEHIPDPAATIAAVAEILKPGGIAVINLPSASGVFFRAALALDRAGIGGPLERLWLKGFSSPHVHFFDAATLERLVTGNAPLRPLDRFPLVPVGRKGLYARIRATHGGLAGAGLFAAIWLASFALPLLPADNLVALFRKPD